MPWLRSLALALVLAVLPVAPAQAAAPERTLRSLVNAERSDRGLPSLRHSPALARSARRFAARLLRRGVLAHEPRIAAPSGFRLIGENLALVEGGGARPHRTRRMWLRSPPHRSVMLHPGMRRIGLGHAAGSFRGHTASVWVLHVGRLGA